MNLLAISPSEKERYWQSHVEGWQRGGESQRTYCDRHHLSLSTFQLWRRRLQSAAAERPFDPSLDLVLVPQPVRPPARGAAIAVLLQDGRYRVEVADQVCAETLQVVLRVLEAQP